MDLHTTWLFILILAEGINSVTVITKPEIDVTLDSNTTVVLNCTYPNDISAATIKWSKVINGDYKNLAAFYPGSYAIFMSDGNFVRNRSYLLNPKNGSTSALLVVYDVICEDNGKYQCDVEYPIKDTLVQASNVTTVNLQVKAEKPSNFEIYQNGNLKENDEVTLSCSANVGNPGGFVSIWKLNKFSNQSIILNKSNEVNEMTENCTMIANLNLTFVVSRNDNNAFFRCFSQNMHTDKTALQKETKAINVQYGPSNVTIKTSSSHLDFFVGDNEELTCICDGNPAPTYKWKFNSTDIVNDERHTLDNKTLFLQKMIFNDSGIYSCSASNSIDGKTFASSSNIFLNVKEKHKDDIKPLQSSCEESACQITEVCSNIDGKAFCHVNFWFFASLVFIFFTLLFMVTTAMLYRRHSRNNSSENFNGALKSSDHSKSRTNDYDLDGYSDPKDVTKLCQSTEKSESENVTYADPVDDQYASVQKDSTKSSNPPNVYDGAWV